MRETTPSVRPRHAAGASSRGDGLFRGVILALALAIVVVFVLALYQLVAGSLPSIERYGFAFLFRTTWNNVTSEFGALPFIIGTLVTSFAALLIAVPLAIASAVFVTEYAPRWLAEPVGYLVELLAAIPSVIYGLWALFVLKPLVVQLGTWIFYQPWIVQNPSLKWLVPSNLAGLGLLTAILILAIMVIPYTASVARDVIRLVPQDQREAMYALGATKWEVIRSAILPFARAGIFGGVILSLGRALGETLAVTMVIGNDPKIVSGLFNPTATMSSIIASEFNEAVNNLQRSSLIEIGLLLFVISVIVNYVARLVIARITVGGTS
ncbi:phosphate ABC transporter permease subunit PstC [Deinococcus pimensis]|uniref:phosphate ABC transporter permease subunit PstC n=1 Tax=Deinococcus pimensis TaxID=309888 RepID=UPI000484F43E|nr:phosphate ABC transporter permease subunit PstC [Deinococcus pimensis]